MLKTTQEAARMYCHLNGVGPPTEHVGYCDGEKCMMWRWYTDIADIGYCGLAGRIK